MINIGLVGRALRLRVPGVRQAVRRVEESRGVVGARRSYLLLLGDFWRAADWRDVARSTSQLVVREVRGRQVKIGIEAPASVRVLREEIYESLVQANRAAATTEKVPAALLGPGTP